MITQLFASIKKLRGNQKLSARLLLRIRFKSTSARYRIVTHDLVQNIILIVRGQRFR